ncbi:uncharacterized protein (TIGR03083 family) [Kribbella amoyensis]|uniref:Uncharacterized protein (TIGR03083 family) n=1 Tax=Kribbella amoyensis TaxID=996641 RepID=A0A561BPT5_9ACTN|nr:maleylpyruvate isomerase family mycothiol-dependent enzyme [Kribbella amoyensis]TWD80880.1 uncharacterized protein (TIGR03083 family) [Kribbella amoyensis]
MADHVWDLVRAERTALAEDLAGLTDAEWETRSLCTELSVREVLAHLTAGATLTFPRWMAGVIRHRFNFDQQLVVRLREYLGDSAGETLAGFRATVPRTTSPFGRWSGTVSMLAETVVHAEDIRRPLGIERTYPEEVLTKVAEHYHGSDMTVPAKSRVKGLHLKATDSPFEAGQGPTVTGPTIALIMTTTGRPAHFPLLSGPGKATLQSRC